MANVVAALSGLEQAAQWATVVGSMGVAGTAWLIYWQLRESKKARIDAARPYITVEIELGRPMLYLVVRNIGHSPARDVRLRFTPDLRSNDTYLQNDLQSAPALNDVIPYMPPGMTLRFGFDTAYDLLRSDLPKQYRVRATYLSDYGKHEPEEYVLDIRSFESAEFPDDPAKGIIDAIRQAANNWPRK